MTKAKNKSITDEETIPQKVKATKSSSAVPSIVDIWRKGGKSSNVSKTNNLLEELIKKSGLK